MSQKIIDLSVNTDDLSVFFLQRFLYYSIITAVSLEQCDQLLLYLNLRFFATGIRWRGDVIIPPWLFMIHHFCFCVSCYLVPCSISASLVRIVMMMLSMLMYVQLSHVYFFFSNPALIHPQIPTITYRWKKKQRRGGGGHRCSLQPFFILEVDCKW